MTVGLLPDASVFIAAEVGRPLKWRPERQARVSVVTLAELRLGVLRAKAFDCFVAATALSHDLTVIAQDADFQDLKAAEPRRSVALV